MMGFGLNKCVKCQHRFNCVIEAVCGNIREITRKIVRFEIDDPPKGLGTPALLKTAIGQCKYAKVKKVEDKKVKDRWSPDDLTIIAVVRFDLKLIQKLRGIE